MFCMIMPQAQNVYGVNIQFALTFLHRACEGNISSVHKENLSLTEVHTHHYVFAINIVHFDEKGQKGP